MAPSTGPQHLEQIASTTMVTTSSPQHVPYQETVRFPVWMAPVDRNSLREALIAALHPAAGCLPHPAYAHHLREVLTELDVAPARNRVWPVPSATVRLATGCTGEVLPIRMSEGERAAVSSLSDLPASVREALSGGTTPP